MPEADFRLAPSQLSVEQVATQINGMIAERAAERLRKVPAVESATEIPRFNHRAPGVYFSLPSAEYHADPSLGSSDLKRLLQAPAVYWWHSHMNPERPPSPDSAAKQKGRALHKLVLEGPEVFKAAFVTEPQPEAYPGALVTLEDLKSRCRQIGELVSGTKAELVKRIKAKDLQAIIFDDIQATFRVMVERDGLEVLKPDAMREVRQAAASITLNPHLARAFQGGIPEVSVFWVDEHGITCKCRFDWLKPRTIVDIKKCANIRDRPFDLAVLLAIAEYRYDMSARHYLDGYCHLYQTRRFCNVPTMTRHWCWQRAASRRPSVQSSVSCRHSPIPLANLSEWARVSAPVARGAFTRSMAVLTPSPRSITSRSRPSAPKKSWRWPHCPARNCSGPQPGPQTSSWRMATLLTAC